MTIAGLKTFGANVPRTNFVFVTLHADEGADEAALERKTLAAVMNGTQL